MTNTNTTAIERCEKCGSYHKPDSPLCVEFAEYRNFQTWLKSQGMETSTDGKVRCDIHGKREGSVIITVSGYVQYLCHHCQLEKFRQMSK